MYNNTRRFQSSFHGIIQEIPGIMVDNFENPVQNKARAFFLSHCHSDHIQGLLSFELLKHLETYNLYIYTTELNAAIIDTEKKDERIMKFVKILPKGSMLITLPSYQDLAEEYVTVSLIPAGHCVGASMFLFKTPSKTILFTGDFRINSNDIPKYKALHHNSDVIRIDSLYVDTTFLNTGYEDFPKRSESVEKLIYEIREWLNKENNAVALHTSAKYGYEYVFNEIYKGLGIKVFVGDAWKLYSIIPHLVPGVTNNEKLSRIHLCRNRCPTTHSKCIKDTSKNFLYVNLSAMKWSHFKTDFTPVKWLTKSRLDVCFATHCSKNELLSFVRYLTPNKIIGFPNVWKSEKRKVSVAVEDCFEQGDMIKKFRSGS